MSIRHISVFLFIRRYCYDLKYFEDSALKYSTSTAHSPIILVKLLASQLVTQYSRFLCSMVHYVIRKWPQRVPLLSQTNPRHAISYFFKIGFNIIVPSTTSSHKFPLPFFSTVHSAFHLIHDSASNWINNDFYCPIFNNGNVMRIKQFLLSVRASVRTIKINSHVNITVPNYFCVRIFLHLFFFFILLQTETYNLHEIPIRLHYTLALCTLQHQYHCPFSIPTSHPKQLQVIKPLSHRRLYIVQFRQV